ncbi:MAG: Putative lipoprotein LpqB [Acetothermia bacterium 64_32]|nr:MAG: Putative lipoprotein LpqB [Acetothermia bacterium 64_32]MBC7098791.1 GerMN domain-containing protein [Candidatus Bipolaricaulota bacterium]
MSDAWPWLLLAALLGVGIFLVAEVGGPLPRPAILSPARGEEVGLPLRVSVGDLPPGAEVGVRLLDAYGRVLAEDAAVADPAGRASLALYYDLPASPRGRLELFLPVPGLEDRVLVARKVRFADVPYTWVKVYFLDPEGNPFPLIRRVPRTQGVGAQALELLLSGPTWRERARGYWSALPAGMELYSLSISSGVAEVWLAGKAGELSPELAALVLAQTEKTLVEFPTVHQVRVYFNGQPLSSVPGYFATQLEATVPAAGL